MREYSVPACCPTSLTGSRHNCDIGHERTFDLRLRKDEHIFPLRQELHGRRRLASVALRPRRRRCSTTVQGDANLGGS